VSSTRPSSPIRTAWTPRRLDDSSVRQGERSRLTLPEAAKRLEAALKDGQILTQPQVNVDVQQYAGQYVTVTGEVGSPGRVALIAPTSLGEILAEAGGETPLAAHTSKSGAALMTLLQRKKFLIRGVRARRRLHLSSCGQATRSSFRAPASSMFWAR